MPAASHNGGSDEGFEYRSDSQGRAGEFDNVALVNSERSR
jgi:hypothetical protein